MGSEYPEHDKMMALRPQISAVTEFLEWLFSSGFEIETPDERPNPGIESLLSWHFEIDQDKIEQEKRAMLIEVRRMNGLDEEGRDATHQG